MTNTKRKNWIAIFFVTLALALIALLGSSFIHIPRTASADGTTHSHKLCGEATCTHDGDAHTQAVEYTPLTKAMLQSLSKTTLDSAPALTEKEFYVVPAGNYYLTESIEDTGCYLLVQQGVTLCLNGYTFKTDYMYVEDGTVNICDCSADKTGVYSTSSGNYGIEIGIKVQEEDGKSPTLNLYSGTVKSYNAIRQNDGTLNIYGGKVEASGTAINVNGGSIANVYGGEVYTSGASAIIFSVVSDQKAILNIYDGTLTGDSNTVLANITGSSTATNACVDINIYGGKFYCDSGGFNIYVHSLASPTNVFNVNINGGEWFVKDTTTVHYFAVYLAGWVNARVTKMKADVTDYSIFYIDPLVNLTIDPEKDEDIQLTTGNNSTVCTFISLKNTSILNADGNPVTPADYGKVLIKGGTFTGEESGVMAAQVKEQTIEISGGIFTATSSSNNLLNISTDAEILISGGSFICSAATQGRVYNTGSLKIVGAPTFTNVVLYTTKSVDDNGEYTLDLSDYTGTQKLCVSAYTNRLPHSQDLILAKGTTSQMVYANADWKLVNAVDDSGNAIVKLNHVAHTGGEPTCTVAATCETCSQQYTLPHTYGEMHGEVAATCTATGTRAYQTCSVCNLNYDANDVLIEDLTIPADTSKHDFGVANDEEGHWKKCSRCGETTAKEAHVYNDDICACGYENPNKGLSVGAIVGIVIGGVVVVGVGGFALVWFVIKKKSWADFLAIFKK